jgi:hypothetical protein
MPVNTSIPGSWARAPSPPPARPPARAGQYGSADAAARSTGSSAARAGEGAAVQRAAGRNQARRPQIYESADAISASPTLVGPEDAASELAAREAAVIRMQQPVTRQTGSGRTGFAGNAGGGGMAPAAAQFIPPETITAPPVAVQPPAVVAEAPPSAVNVPGESFTTVGNPSAFGTYERKRQNRGPKSSLSVTPEMIRRAAAQRLG